MERLTKRIGSSVVYSKFNHNNTDGCYEMMDNCLHKLADYEDAEEQGLLLRLPYPLGTKKVYAIDEDYGGVCDIIELDARDLQIDKSDISDRPIFIIDTFEYYEGDFGKTVFLTKKEAEQALQKMKEGAE